ncbi:hypothetical protein ILUMI_20132 [Ignelater luminosus]|uniref:Uncharacterized protein n=1 Tax=Ignelater luminosus TaxID=2038154 RepID=A0A8K0CL69_IGNLU|nr:hypothetical protein ILUMI_20132 [Ignelater luminosus]
MEILEDDVEQNEEKKDSDDSTAALNKGDKCFEYIVEQFPELSDAKLKEDYSKEQGERFHQDLKEMEGDTRADRTSV